MDPFAAVREVRGREYNPDNDKEWRYHYTCTVDGCGFVHLSDYGWPPTPPEGWSKTLKTCPTCMEHWGERGYVPTAGPR